MQDVSSLSNFQEIQTKHAELSFTPNFDSKTIKSSAAYTMVSSLGGLRTIVLDCKEINVLSVSPCAKWELGDPHEVLGSSLIITLESPLEKDQEFVLTVDSETTTKCSAVQFLEASQTAGKVHPYCYTQCEAIHCRTLLPIQDTPSIKFPISYTMTVPDGLSAAVAGIPSSTTGNVYTFTQPVPVPAYLIAFAVGNLHSQTIGPRSKVYAEPEILDACVYEFGLTEDQLQAAEALMGPYIWGELNLLILPPSFGYGGMENPNLVFVTPSLLAGDRSLISVIAHEIAHSWTGNTVTNSSWEHFWLNEGFTVYFERKITGYLYGRSLSHLDGINGYRALEETVKLFGEDSNFTRLNLSLAGIDPDDAFSRVPYEKGCIFLLYLESLVGEEEFMGFLQEYVRTFQGKSISASDFEAFFKSKFSQEVNWELWLRGTGMPPFVPDFDASLVMQVDGLFSKWQDSEYVPSASDIQGWHSSQTVRLLDKFCESPEAHYLKAGDAYGFTKTKNSEIRLGWCSLVLKLQASQHFAEVQEFLQGTGRMKFVRPLFRLMSSQGNTEMAQEILNSCGDFYHPTLLGLLNKELGLTN